MGLRDLPLPSAMVELSSGVQFTVRGLSPTDALGLYYRHTGALSALFDKLREQGTVERADIVAVGETLISQAPRLVAEIIALASDDCDPSSDEFSKDVEAAVRLPAGAQLDALQKIGDLTFTSEMPAGKFLAVVVSMTRTATATLAAPEA